MSGFYPHAPKMYEFELSKEKYNVVHRYTREVVETVTHLKDALRTVERKNNALR